MLEKNSIIPNFPIEFPTLYTERLIMREVAPQDQDTVVQIFNHYDTIKYITFAPYPFTAEHFQNLVYKKAQDGFKSKENIIYAIALKEKPNQILGMIGYFFSPYNENANSLAIMESKYWNQGYVTEAGIRGIKYGFEVLHIRKITGQYFEVNIGSGKVQAKCGMHIEGCVKDEVKKFGKYYNKIHTAIFNPNKEYLK